MRFVDCELQKGHHSSIEFSGFEITVLITELMLLDAILEKYFKKLRGLYDFKSALLEAHNMLNKGGKIDFLEHKIIVAIPKDTINIIFDDLVYIATAFSESGCENIVEYEDTFNKLISFRKEIIKLSDSDNKLVVIPAEALENSVQTDITIN